LSKFCIRFNQTRGQPGRGTAEHVWRVFEDGKERLFKHLQITVPIWDERDGEQWNVCCEGVLTIDRETSTAIIQLPDGKKGKEHG
jgi:hypothetical protein